ncbi:lytic transglycosylase domain-containing protein [Nocardioides jiangxiensis]|uniref:Lytic transglycosylase domain-containing protein n=1 Tax=Nocardioides jiangxiensis TaxID=3064524 RepID=A0ABT9B1Y9_9ACTN|nr:lytic transglycosylase domain-containing protein [Nocardioides sp. WY-20]MDO7868854.1 lytic transglycosylase domain-containing protein [Nocardioides sp. WY-20]
MKYVPKHRGDAVPATEAPKKLLRNSVVFSAIAVGATGSAVATGLVTDGGSPAVAAAAADIDLATVNGINGADIERDPVVSRSDRRDAPSAAKVAPLAATDSVANGYTRTEDIRDLDPRSVAKALLSDFGWSSDQFGCLDSLWNRESGWNIHADNPGSSAYGIPQALPGSKMASAGPDWQNNPVTQITWGLGYIQDRYGSPCGAWGHSQGYGWY